MAKAGKISLLLGIVTGTVTGLLFAPQKGKELRGKIAKERAGGGLGHKALAAELTRMTDDISHLVKDVAKSEEALAFFHKANNAVNDWTGGSVELDHWVKEAHRKADLLKKTVSKYADEKKKVMTVAKGTAKKVVRRVKSTAKKVKRAGKKLKTTAKKTTAKKKA